MGILLRCIICRHLIIDERNIYPEELTEENIRDIGASDAYLVPAEINYMIFRCPKNPVGKYLVHGCPEFEENPNTDNFCFRIFENRR